MSGIEVWPATTGVQVIEGATTIDVGLQTFVVEVVSEPSWAQLTGTFIESFDIRRAFKMTAAEFALITPDPLAVYFLTA